MKKVLILMVATLSTLNASAYNCSSTGGPQFGGKVTASQLAPDGAGLWISGIDSYTPSGGVSPNGYGPTEIITAPTYKPPLEVLLACIDAARRAQTSPTVFRLIVTGNYTFSPNIWGSNNCGFVVSGNLSCQLQNF